MGYPYQSSITMKEIIELYHSHNSYFFLCLKSLPQLALKWLKMKKKKTSRD